MVEEICEWYFLSSLVVPVCVSVYMRHLCVTINFWVFSSFTTTAAACYFFDFLIKYFVWKEKRLYYLCINHLTFVGVLINKVLNPIKITCTWYMFIIVYFLNIAVCIFLFCSCFIAAASSTDGDHDDNASFSIYV